MWKKTILSLWTLSVCYVIYVSVIPSPEVPLEFDFADKVYHTLPTFGWASCRPSGLIHERMPGAQPCLLFFSALRWKLFNPFSQPEVASWVMCWLTPSDRYPVFTWDYLRRTAWWYSVTSEKETTKVLQGIVFNKKSRGLASPAFLSVPSD